MAVALDGRPAFLTFIELRNFKSFLGKVMIKPLEKLTSIVGKNGIGKSNLLDAFAFVLGCDESLWRVQNYRDLITRGSEIESTTSVTVCFAQNGDEFSFKKEIAADLLKHFFNDEEVTHEEYRTTLANIGVAKIGEHFSTGSHFRATLSPVELTALLERVGGSGELAAACDGASADVSVLKRRVDNQSLALNDLKIRRQQHLQAINVSEKFQLLKNQMVLEQQKFYLFKLFHLEREIIDLAVVESQLLDEVENNQRKLTDATNEKDYNSLTINELQQQIGEATGARDLQLKKVFDLRMVAQKSAVSWDNNLNLLELSRLMLSVTRSAHTLIAEMDGQLTDRLETLQKRKAVLIDRKPAEFAVNLMEAHTVEQMQRYSRLSTQVKSRNSTVQSELDKLVSGSRDLDDRQIFGSTKLDSLHEQLRTKQKDLLNNYRRLLHLEFNHVTDFMVAELDKTISEKENKLSRVKLIRKELQDIDNDLLCVKLYRIKQIRKRRLDDLVVNLRQMFSGSVVYGCIRELYKRDRTSPYWPLVDDILDPHLDTIVVDSRPTIHKCLAFVEGAQSEGASFIAASDMDTLPSKKNISLLQNNDQYVFLHDQITVTDQAVMAVFKYLTKDVVIDKTNDTSNPHNIKGLVVVTAHDNNQRFMKRGAVFGYVSVDQAMRTQREWSEEEEFQLVRRQRDLKWELDEIHVHIFDKYECDLLKRQRDDLLAKRLGNSIEKECEELREGITYLCSSIRTLETELENVQEEVKIKDERADAIRLQISVAENEVFADFCREVGVDNIREFDGLGPDSYYWFSEMSQLELLINKLEMESKLDISDNWSDEHWQELESHWKVEFTKYSDTANADNQSRSEADELENRNVEELKEINERVGLMDWDLIKKQNEARTLESDFGLATNEVSRSEQRLARHREAILQKRFSRHFLLKTCKVADHLDLPMTSGSLDDVDLRTLSFAEGQTIYDDDTMAALDVESSFRFNYDSLNVELINLTSYEEVSRREQEMLDNQNTILSNLRDCSGQNESVSKDRVQEITRRIVKTRTDVNNLTAGLLVARNRFADASEQRKQRFTDCFDAVQMHLSTLYQDINNDRNAQALLVAINEETPYSDGVLFTTIVPNKFPRTVDSLSTGEKTLASLALFFAVHKFNQSPLVFLDDVGANLDDDKIQRVARFIQRQSEEDDTQTVVVSHSVHMEQYCDAVIGLFQHHDDGRPQGIIYNASGQRF